MDKEYDLSKHSSGLAAMLRVGSGNFVYSLISKRAGRITIAADLSASDAIVGLPIAARSLNSIVQYNNFVNSPVLNSIILVSSTAISMAIAFAVYNKAISRVSERMGRKRIQKLENSTLCD